MAQLAKTRNSGLTAASCPNTAHAPGVEADGTLYAYYFYANSYFGRSGGNRAGSQGRRPSRRRQGLAAAEELRGEIIRAFKEAQALAPVVRFETGRGCVLPASVYTPGLMATTTRQDGNRSWCSTSI